MMQVLNRSTLMRALAAIAGTFACVLIAGSVNAAGAPSTALLARNLIVNGGAEAGSALPQKVASIPGWSTTGHFTAVTYGYDDYPSATSPGPTDRGKHFFSGGTNDPISTASQTIDVSSLRDSIDRGGIQYVFFAWIGGWAGQQDYATVAATFYDAEKKRLGGATLGPVTVGARKGVTSLLYRQAVGHVPAGTRSILVKITATRFEGSSNDGYTDDISLILKG
ncbi:MAG: hypothetical protein JO194_04705 [Candidatus Eremiobacteraeota bacterium]|nr:hypothetical protein [Candidatus Eremiobacteraeota bacterium]